MFKKMYEFPEKNKKGERISVLIQTNCNNKQHKEVLNAQVFVYKPNGWCVEDYNPMVRVVTTQDKYGRKSYRQEINEDWELDYTEENKMKLLNKIEELAFS